MAFCRASVLVNIYPLSCLVLMLFGASLQEVHRKDEQLRPYILWILHHQWIKGMILFLLKAHRALFPYFSPVGFILATSLFPQTTKAKKTYVNSDTCTSISPLCSRSAYGLLTFQKIRIKRRKTDKISKDKGLFLVAKCKGCFPCVQQWLCARGGLWKSNRTLWNNL